MMKFVQGHTSDLFKTLLLITTPFLSYCLPFLVPIPASIAQAIRHGFGLEIIIASVVLIWGFSFHREQDWIPKTIIFILFGAGLAALWSIPLSEGQVVGGRLYFSDSSRYYADALRLLNGFPISNFSARHPLPTLFFSIILLITGNNLAITLAIITAIAAWATWMVANEVRKNWGEIPAGIFCVLLFLFYRRFSGMADSENLGFIFGCLGFSQILTILRTNSFSSFWNGLFILSLGLTARPGPFFVIPAILVWRKKIDSRPGLFRFKPFLLGILFIGLAFLMNYAINKVLADREDQLFSNFSYTFYGITQGGKGWEQFFSDYPELLSSPEIDAEQVAIKKGLEELSSKPVLTFQGILIGYRDFFSIQPISIFGFLGNDPSKDSTWMNESYQQSINYLLRLIVSIFALVGLIFLYINRKKLANGFLISVVVGTIASVPFLPPIDSGIMRTYIVIIPFVLILPIIGVCFIFKLRMPDDALQRESGIPSALILSNVITLALLVIMLVFAFLKKLPVENIPMCTTPDSAKAVLVSNPGSYLHLVDDGNTNKPTNTDVSYSKFRSSFLSLQKYNLMVALNSISPDKLVMNNINLVNGQQLWVSLPLSSEKWNGHKVLVCGRWNLKFREIGLGFLEGEEVRLFETP